MVTLLMETDRFVIVKNEDHHLIDFRSVWISTRNKVGQVFGNFLKCLHESGICSFWSRNWQKYVDGAGVRIIPHFSQEYNGSRRGVHSSKR